MNSVSKTIVAALDKALGRETDPVKKIYLAILETADGEVISADERKRLAVLQREYQNSYNAAAELFCHTAAKKFYHDHLAEHGKLSRSGTLGDVRTRSWESVQTEFLAKQTASKNAMYSVAAEAAAIGYPILERFCKAAENSSPAAKPLKKARPKSSDCNMSRPP